MITTTPQTLLTTDELTELPVIVIGAGPIGLAAAANAAERGLPFAVLEVGHDAGAAVGEWAHVRLFSAWRELIDPAARRLLEAEDSWTAPDEGTYPTGREWRDAYLLPLADVLDSLPGGSVRYDARVVGVSRAGRDLLVDSGRENDPFAVPSRPLPATSGCWAARSSTRRAPGRQPNPLGADGYPALGERENAGRITYGVPDFEDATVAARYAGKHVAVAGKGASAQGVLIGLARLAAGMQVRVAGPESPGRCGAPAWETRSGAVTTTSSRSAEGSVSRRRRQRPAAWSPTSPSSAPSPSPARQTADWSSARSTAGRSPMSTRSSWSPGSVPTSPSSPRCASTSTPPWCGARARRPGPPRPPQLRRRRPARLPGTGPARTEPLPGRDEVLRPRTLVPRDDRVRAGSLGRGRAGGDLEAAARVELVLPETGVCNGSGAFDAPDAVSVGGSGCCGAPAASEPQLVTLGRLGQ